MFHSFCIQYPRSRYVIVRESQTTLDRTIIPTFRKFIESGFSYYIESFNTKKVVYRNGSEILFMAESYSMDKELNRFKGLEINGAGVDELNEIQEVTLEKLIERSGTHFIDPMPPPKILCTCNPSFTWVKKKFYDHWKKGTLKKSFAYIPAKITDNPYVPKEYLQSIKENMSRVQYERFVEGDWEIKEHSDNAFATMFNEEKHIGNVNLVESQRLIISMDFNISPFSCIIAQLYRDEKGEHLHVINELTIFKGSIPKLCDELVSLYGHRLHSAIITGDAMGSRGDISNRENASLYAQIKSSLRLQDSQIKVPANPKHVNSRADVNYVLQHFPDLKINEKCVNLIRDLLYVEVDMYGSIVKHNRNEEEQRADHLDAFRYLINTFMRPWIDKHSKTFNKFTNINKLNKDE